MYAAHIAEAASSHSEADRVVADLEPAEHEHADGGEAEGDGVAGGARHRRGDDDRADELDGDALAEVGAVDAEVEERVHQRRGDAEDGRRGELAAGPAARTRWRDDEQRDRRADDAEPGDGLRGDLVEQERRRSTRPMYWAIAESDEQRLGRRGVERGGRRGPGGPRHGRPWRQSNRSGSVRQISCQSGWN